MSDEDLVGYGAAPPFAGWPGWARIAVNVVLHYGTGGDDAYGTRAGFWRLHRLLTDRRIPVTVFATADALERNPAALDAMRAAGWELAASMAAGEAAREHVADAIERHARLTGERPLGWHADAATPETARLIAEEGGFTYDSSSANDDLPYYDRRYGRAQLILPCSPDSDDRMAATGDGEPFFRCLRDTFDQLRVEGGRMMTVGLRPGIAGRPAKALAMARFADHMIASGDAWITGRIDIAHHWLDRHPV